MTFKEVIWEAIGYVVLYKRQLSQALLIPLTLSILVNMASASDELNSFSSAVLTLLSIVVQTLFAITTHRIILLGPEAVPKWGLFKWSKRETFFALHLLGLGIISTLILMLVFIPFVGLLFASGLIIWGVGRLSLVFPGIAVDQGVTFKLSWAITKNHQMLMCLVVAVFPTLLLIPTIPLSFLPYSLPITSFLTAFATVFMVAALSVTYKVIYQNAYKS